MKKITIVLAAMLVAGLAAACAQNQKKEKKMDNEGNQKILVAYFSASGNTRQAAVMLAGVMGADLHEIRPETTYTNADLDWNDPKSRSSLEMKDLSSRPAITGKIGNMAGYDVVFIGFPIWWYTAPTIINTFMESYDFKGKTLIPFATSGGSTIDKSAKDLKQTYPELDWKPGRLLNRATKDDLAAWKKTLGY